MYVDGDFGVDWIGGAFSGGDRSGGASTACIYDFAGGLGLDWRGIVMIRVVWVGFVLGGKPGRTEEIWRNGDVLVAGRLVLRAD